MPFHSGIGVAVFISMEMYEPNRSREFCAVVSLRNGLRKSIDAPSPCPCVPMGCEYTIASMPRCFISTIVLVNTDPPVTPGRA